MNLAQDGHVHIAVDKSSKYELVAATLKSLDGYGFKVGFVNVDLYDGSGLTQLSADYYLSNTFTIGVLGNASFGDRRTDFGSLPGAASILIKLARYF